MYRDEKYDVAVCGGGISGCMAAWAAARSGLRTILLERYNALGGMATSGLVQPITMWGIGGAYALAGTGKRFLEELHQKYPRAVGEMGCYGPVCDPELIKFELEQQLVQAGVDIRYQTWVHGAKREESSLHALRALTKEGEREIPAAFFIDASGDGDVGFFAGEKFTIGRQGATIMFVIAGIHKKDLLSREKMDELWKGVQDEFSGYRRLCYFVHPRGDTFFMNMTEVDQLEALSSVEISRASIICRKQAWEIWRLLQRDFPGFENSYIQQTAHTLGVRESRHLQSGYILTGDDIAAGKEFPDTVCRGCSPIDIHGNDNEGRNIYHTLERGFAIPYRTMLPSKTDNLLVTGRAVGADPTAHSSLRRMANMFSLGEAAGEAAVLAVKEGVSAHKVPRDLYRRRLLERDFILDPIA